MNLSFVLVIAALICFLLAAFGVPSKVNLTALGLALWIGSTLV